MGIRTATTVFLTAFCLAATARAEPVPKHWQRLGTVQEWDEIDFRRGHWVLGARWESHTLYDGDQRAIYRRTLVHSSARPRVNLAAWDALSPAEQSARRREAADKLGFVADFHRRIVDKRGTWGRRDDIDVVSQCLERLHTAVGLDPTHAYAWHLLGYLSACVGDTRRAAAAFGEAERALDLLGRDKHVGVRRRLALDRAWLRRNQGDLARARHQVEVAETNGGADTETKLLRGLIAVIEGNELEALALADEVGHITVARKHAWGYREAPSDFARAWIIALYWLKLGDPDTAKGAFRKYDFEDRYPFAHHFWNDAGGIYRRTGRPDEARAAWRLANFWTPYRPFFVDVRYAWEDTELTGLEGTALEFCPFDSFYLAGDRLAYVARHALVLFETEDENLKFSLAGIALEQAEICKRTDYLAGYASLIEAMIYHALGDLASSGHALRGGRKWLRERGLEIPAPAAGTEVVIIRSSTGKWDDDPERTLAVLTETWNADRSEENSKALGLFLIRHGNPADGRRLVAGADAEAVDPLTLPPEDICLLLEADRALGDRTLAGSLIEALAAGREGLPADSQVWALAAFCFIDNGDRETGRIALARAHELDPDNAALGMQLRILDH